MNIKYVIGDATRPEGDGTKIIAHICNNAGGWGAGFVLALSARWPQPECEYRHESMSGLLLGEIQLVKVEPDLYVANMIAQHGYGTRGRPPIRYTALVDCLNGLADKARALAASVHMPRIGSGLAGGHWSAIAAIIKETLCDQGIQVTVYELDGKR